MPDKDQLRDDQFEETSTQLSDGLKTCRAVVSGYRSLLGADEPEAHDEPPGDEASDAEGRVEDA